MTLDLEAFRRGLRHWRTRSDTIEEALDGGDEYMEAAVALLHDRNESVRWSAIRTDSKERS